MRGGADGVVAVVSSTSTSSEEHSDEVANDTDVNLSVATAPKNDEAHGHQEDTYDITNGKVTPGKRPVLRIGSREIRMSEKCGYLCALFVCLLTLVIVLCTTLIPRDRPERHYYVGIDEVEWDYAPGPVNNCSGLPFAYPEAKYTARSAKRIGSKYLKSVFREYTDATFQVLKPREAKWEHLGLLGPALHAQVGDVVNVVVRNNARYPFSFSTQAVGTNKANEGVSSAQLDRRPKYMTYDDALPPLSLGVRDCGTTNTFLAWFLPTVSAGRVAPGEAHNDANAIDAQGYCQNHKVKPSESRTYTFLVDEESGPGARDGSSVMHLYTSHVGGHSMTVRDGGSDGFGADTNAGLVGPLIVSRKGHANPDGSPKDVDRELVVLMGVQDENDSPYMRTNIWNKLVAPILNQARPAGFVPFGPTTKVEALLKLYNYATSGLDKLSYADAERLVNEANAQHTYVGVVRGVDIHVWFNEPHFNPRWYDAANGGYGSALHALEELWKEMVDVNDPSFMESNAMHTVNGYLYCEQPGLTAKMGERVRWYSASVGGVDAVHTPHWHGNTVVYNGGRGDQFELLASSVGVADMVPENPGTWQLHCHVNDHKKAGMLSLYTIDAAGQPAPSATCAGLGGTTRTYYIAAEEVEWDYYDAAQDFDLCANAGLSTGLETKWLRRALESNGVDRVGTRFKKARYVQYTDSTFTTRVASPAWAGILGPILRGAVGDTIRVVARNTLSRNISWHPHGVQYQKGAEGAPYNDGTSGADKLDDIIQPGGEHTYVWCVPESAGPGPDDGSSIAWLYHDHVHEINGTNAGLVGAILVSRSDSANADATPKDVDHEFVLLFAAMNENGALHTEENLGPSRLPHFDGNNMSLAVETRARLTYEMRKYDAAFADAMRKRAINGKMQCSLPGLEWTLGSRVRMHFLSVGDEELHAPSLTGQSFTYQGSRHPTVGLMASSMKTVDFKAVANGTLLLSTGSDSGAMRGMLAKAHVSGSPPPAPRSKRTYYIAADEVEWDFLPTGENKCGTGGHGDTASREHADTLHVEHARAGGYQGLAPGKGYNGWADNGLESEFSLYTDRMAAPHRIGTKYVLALFREYTGSGFSTLRHGAKSRANAVSAHLGLQGPVLRAKPGETITVVLHNRLRYACNFVLSGMRPAGGIADERPLLPGETRTISYVIDSDNAPASAQESAALHYRSDYRAAMAAQAAHTAATGAVAPHASLRFADSNAGLFGALIVTSGGAREDLAPEDVNREFVMFMGVMDQNLSPYLDMNIAQFTASPETVDKLHPDFVESNRMHSINGRMYCNLEGLDVAIDRTARWYVLALGTDDAFASPRWYGHAPTVQGRRPSTLLVQPGTSVAADVKHNNYGLWLFEDQTSDHAHAGAIALFETKRKILGLCEIAFYAKC